MMQIKLTKTNFKLLMHIEMKIYFSAQKFQSMMILEIVIKFSKKTNFQIKQLNNQKKL